MRWWPLGPAWLGWLQIKGWQRTRPPVPGLFPQEELAGVLVVSLLHSLGKERLSSGSAGADPA